MLERPRVQTLWVESVTRAHRQLINVLEDDVPAFSTEGGQVVLDLQPLMIQLGERIAVFGAVAERFGPDAGRIEIMEADRLETAQDLTQTLKFLGSWLWVLPVLLAAIALWIARGRRLSILRMIAIASILAGLLVLVVRRLAGSYVVEELVQSETVRPAVQNAWDILTAQLRDGGLTLFGLGLIFLLAGWLGGRSTSGVGARRTLAPYLARAEIAYGAAALLFLAPALVAADRADEPRAADARRRRPARARGRAAPTPDRAGGSRSTVGRPTQGALSDEESAAENAAPDRE